MTITLAPLLLAASALVQPSPARPADQRIEAGLERCQRITGKDERLACFDAEVGQLLDAARGGRVVLVDQRTVRETRRSLFGFSLPRLPLLGGAGGETAGDQEMTSTIRSARAIGNGHYRFSLADGGAVWETTESYVNFDPPAAGQKVVIRRGPLGSYMIRIAGQRGVRGRRVG